MSEGQEKILKAIKESYRNGRLVPFVGAGFSKNVEEFLTWDEFIQKLSSKLSPPDNDKYFLQNKFKGYTFQAMASEYYACRKLLKDNGKATKIDRDSLRAIIQDEINTYLGRSENSVIHKLLIQMFSYIYTTNWDKLLECQCTNNLLLEPVYSIGRIAELWTLKNEKKNILIKMHGSCDDLGSIIVLETDYWDLIHGKHKNLSLNILFQHDIMQRDFIFIGFGFSDLNINNLIYMINTLKKELDSKLTETPKIFMVVFDDYDHYLERYYSDLKGVEVYFMSNISEDSKDKSDAIEKFLYELDLYKINKCSETSSIKTGKSGKSKEELEGCIYHINSTLKNNFSKFIVKKRLEFEKRIELLEDNLEKIGESKNYEDLKEEFEKEKERTKLELERLGRS